MSADVITFPRRPVGRETTPNGTIYVMPSERHGGSWDVYHESRSGDSWGHLSNHFSFNEAERAAKAKAAEIGTELAL